MITRLLIFFCLQLAASPVLAADKPVDVMILGTYHFSNPGLDVNNMTADNVLTPKRQSELDAVARAILEFKPSHVMVEVESDLPDFAVDSYLSFSPEVLKTNANEITQIGYRIAHMTGLVSVNGIDEQPKAGEPDYFPYDELQEAAVKFGQSGMIDAASAAIGTTMKAFEDSQKSRTIGELLIALNTGDFVNADMQFYYGVLGVGDRDIQSGADLNAMWYLRNAKIFSKLMLETKPGDRVLVVYGSGHSYWLRHFASETPGYRMVDPVPYLELAKVRN